MCARACFHLAADWFCDLESQFPFLIIKNTFRQKLFVGRAVLEKYTLIKYIKRDSREKEENPKRYYIQTVFFIRKKKKKSNY